MWKRPLLIGAGLTEHIGGDTTMVEMFPVASSRISEMGYDADTATVYVRFTDGASWRYMNVPADVWEQFVASPSKGRFIKEVLESYSHGPGGM